MKFLYSFFLFVSVAFTSLQLLVAEEPPVSATSPTLPAMTTSPAPVDVQQPSEKKEASKNGTDATKGAVETPSTAQETEPNNSVVPTDPSMIPPPETAASDGSATSTMPVPTDPNGMTLSSPETAEATPSSPVNSTESIEKKKLLEKVRYNQLRTEVEKNGEVAVLKTKADHAKTDEEKRQALCAYYNLLFKKMKKADPSITERCNLMEAAYIRRLSQVRIEPTIP